MMTATSPSSNCILQSIMYMYIYPYVYICIGLRRIQNCVVIDQVEKHGRVHFRALCVDASIDLLAGKEKITKVKMESAGNRILTHLDFSNIQANQCRWKQRFRNSNMREWDSCRCAKQGSKEQLHVYINLTEF